MSTMSAWQTLDIGSPYDDNMGGDVFSRIFILPNTRTNPYEFGIRHFERAILCSLVVEDKVKAGKALSGVLEAVVAGMVAGPLFTATAQAETIVYPTNSAGLPIGEPSAVHEAALVVTKSPGTEHFKLTIEDHSIATMLDACTKYSVVVAIGEWSATQLDGLPDMLRGVVRVTGDRAITDSPKLLHLKSSWVEAVLGIAALNPDDCMKLPAEVQERLDAFPRVPVAVQDKDDPEVFHGAGDSGDFVEANAKRLLLADAFLKTDGGLAVKYIEAMHQRRTEYEYRDRFRDLLKE